MFDDVYMTSRTMRMPISALVRRVCATQALPRCAPHRTFSSTERDGLADPRTNAGAAMSEAAPSPVPRRPAPGTMREMDPGLIDAMNEWGPVDVSSPCSLPLTAYDVPQEMRDRYMTRYTLVVEDEGFDRTRGAVAHPHKPTRKGLPKARNAPDYKRINQEWEQARAEEGSGKLAEAQIKELAEARRDQGASDARLATTYSLDPGAVAKLTSFIAAPHFRYLRKAKMNLGTWEPFEDEAEEFEALRARVADSGDGEDMDVQGEEATVDRG